MTITPFGMRKTLNWIKERFNDPEIIITENGISDRAGNVDDMMRVYYYKHNINSMLKGNFIVVEEVEEKSMPD